MRNSGKEPEKKFSGYKYIDLQVPGILIGKIGTPRIKPYYKIYILKKEENCISNPIGGKL